MAGAYIVRLSLSLNEMRTIIKSLSIGCDQLSKKMDRLYGTSRYVEVAREYGLLVRTKFHFERELVKMLDEHDEVLAEGGEDCAGSE